jgi:hypothetical protein
MQAVARGRLTNTAITHLVKLGGTIVVHGTPPTKADT